MFHTTWGGRKEITPPPKDKFLIAGSTFGFGEKAVEHALDRGLCIIRARIVHMYSGQHPSQRARPSAARLVGQNGEGLC
jgi:hypothetical protein